MTLNWNCYFFMEIMEETIANEDAPMYPQLFSQFELLIKGDGAQAMNPEIWKIRSKFVSITPQDLQSWEQFIEGNNQWSPEKKADELAAALGIYAEKYPTPLNYCRYLDHIANDHMVVLQALEECGADYLNGNMVWDRFLSHNDVGDMPAIVLEKFKQRLRIPHRQIQETYDQFSKWVSSALPDEYTVIMREGSKLINETQKQMRYIERLESRVRDDPLNPQSWIEYIDKIAKFAFSKQRDGQPIINVKTLSQIFYRSLSSNLENPEWIQVWLFYLQAFERAQEMELKEYVVTARELIRTFPRIPHAYGPLLRNLENADELLFVADQWLHCLPPSVTETMHGWQNSLIDLLGSALRFGNVPLLLELCREYGLLAALQNLKESRELFKVIILLLERINTSDSISVATNLAVLFFEEFAQETDSWLYCFNFFVRFLPKHVQKLLKIWKEDALDVDDPEKLIHEILLYIQIYGEPKAYIEASNTANDLRQKISKSKENEITTSNTKIPEDETASEAKRHKSQTEEEEAPKRSREQFRIVLSPVSEDVHEQDVRSFFDGYGEPVSIQILNSNPKIVIVELHSEQEVLTCLTRDLKPLNGQPIKISRLFANTVWITNYPPQYLLQDLQNLVKTTGKVPVDIRLPSQVDLKQRRFCYVDFASAEDAQEARNLLDGVEIDQYQIHTEISNPLLKRERKSPSPARQVYVHNLNFKLTLETSLREFFLQFGDFEAINIPLSDNNRAKGNVNNGFAFITFTTELAAKEAIALGGAQLDGRRIEISAVKTKEKLQSANAAHFNADSSVSIQNVNEKVNSDQLKTFLEQKVGAVRRIILKPSQKSALVEFETSKDAGKVGLLLEGVEYEDYILHVGLKADFIRATSSTSHSSTSVPTNGASNVPTNAPTSGASNTPTKVPTMVPPMLMRRRKRR